MKRLWRARLRNPSPGSHAEAIAAVLPTNTGRKHRLLRALHAGQRVRGRRGFGIIKAFS